MRKLYLSKEDSKIFGVCGGIGQTYDIDPTLVRRSDVSPAGSGLLMLCIGDTTLSPDLHHSMGNSPERTDSIDDYQLTCLRQKLDL